MKNLKKLLALVFAIGAVAMLWQGGGFIWLGILSLIAGLLVLARPDSGDQVETEAMAEYDNLRHGHPSRDTTRSDSFLHGPPGGWGPGDGGSV